MARAVTLRERLRKLIGWDEMRERLDLTDSRLVVLVERVDAQDRRIDLVAYKRAIKPLAEPAMDWEALQVEFANNPENFKEAN